MSLQKRFGWPPSLDRKERRESDTEHGTTNKERKREKERKEREKSEKMVTGTLSKQTFSPTQVPTGPYLRNPATISGQTSAVCCWWHPITATPTNVGPRWNILVATPFRGLFLRVAKDPLLYIVLLLQHSATRVVL